MDGQATALTGCCWVVIPDGSENKFGKDVLLLMSGSISDTFLGLWLN